MLTACSALGEEGEEKGQPKHPRPALDVDAGPAHAPEHRQQLSPAAHSSLSRNNGVYGTGQRIKGATAVHRLAFRKHGGAAFWVCRRLRFRDAVVVLYVRRVDDTMDLLTFGSIDIPNLNYEHTNNFLGGPGCIWRLLMWTCSFLVQHAHHPITGTTLWVAPVPTPALKSYRREIYPS